MKARKKAPGANLATARLLAVIGLGGIGSVVAPAVAHFMFSRRLRAPLFLIDGDDYEEKNKERVLFDSYGNKALVKARELDRAFDHRVNVVGIPEYLTPGNLRRIIGEGVVALLCVDNHATRRLASNHCRRLNDAVLISGGNDGVENGRTGTFGNVQVYVRAGGRDVTNPLTRFHPEIARPQDKRPDELGCGALAKSAPQLFFTNMTVASAMLGTFYSWHCGRLDYEEIYLDISLGRMTPVKRSTKGVGVPSR